MKKRVFVLLCLLTALYGGFSARAYAGNSAYAFDYVYIQPFWTHITLISAGLRIDNGRATMTGMVQGRSGTERISVNAVLERVNANGTTSQVGSWSNIQATGAIWVWDRQHNVTRGYDYRLTLTATVFRNGASETVSESRTARAN